MPEADILFVGGPVLTMADPRVAEALAVAGNRILAVGERAEVERHAGRGTRVVELGGRPLLPGFVDAHTHFVQYGVRLLRLNLARCASKDELLQEVRERARMTPEDGWVVGHSWDESKWPEGARPTREELDAVAGKHPVILSRVDRHMGVLSTAALVELGLDAAAHADGALYEGDYYAAVERVNPTLDTMVKGVRHASRKAAELGVTSVHVMASLDDHSALTTARDEGALGVRATCFFQMQAVEPALERGWKRGEGDAWVRVNGIKLYTDGSIGSRTAAVTTGYFGNPDIKGDLLYDDRSFGALVERVHAAGLQLAVHAIGDVAVAQALRALEGAGPGSEDARHRIEHLELFSDEQAERLARAGVVASVQPNFVGEWGFPGQMYEQRLGHDVVARHNRFRRLLDVGAHLAFGSDDMPLGPLYGIHYAVNGPTPEQSIPVEAALRAYTLGAAEAGFGEDEVGSLEAGKLADLVILSEDPRGAADRLKNLTVEMTVLDGRVVYERPPG